jgi:hypothetical protein
MQEARSLVASVGTVGGDEHVQHGPVEDVDAGHDEGAVAREAFAAALRALPGGLHPLAIEAVDLAPSRARRQVVREVDVAQPVVVALAAAVDESSPGVDGQAVRDRFRVGAAGKRVEEDPYDDCKQQREADAGAYAAGVFPV